MRNKQRTLDLLQEAYPMDEVLDDRILFLQTNYKLTRDQAQRTVALFPDPKEVENVASYYFSIKNPTQRKLNFGRYDDYLARLLECIVFAEQTPYMAEVQERTSLVPSERLVRTNYRDRPTCSRHYWEHAATTLFD